MSIKITSKWSAPLKFDYIWHFDKLDNRISRNIDKTFKNTTGRLASSFTFKELSPNSVQIRSTAPYAAAQEWGANIPERVPVNAKALHWNGIFAMSAAAFKLRARPYLIPAIKEWLPNDVDVKWSK